MLISYYALQISHSPLWKKGTKRNDRSVVIKKGVSRDSLCRCFQLSKSGGRFFAQKSDEGRDELTHCPIHRKMVIYRSRSQWLSISAALMVLTEVTVMQAPLSRASNSVIFGISTMMHKYTFLVLQSRSVFGVAPSHMTSAAFLFTHHNSETLHPRHEAEYYIIGIASMWLRYPSLGVCKTVINSYLRETE